MKKNNPNSKKPLSNKLEKFKDSTENTLKDLKKSIEDYSGKTRELIDGTSDEVKDLIGGKKDLTARTLNYLEKSSKQVKVKFKDDIDIIKQECYLLNRLRENKLPLSVKQSTLYATLGTGIIFNESDLAGLTRSIMDSDSSFFQRLLNFLFDRTEVKEINKWMDTIPGSDIPGGFAHRIHHGHDLEALKQLIQNHDSEGFLEWINHVWFRDFWTPHGVPYIPSGSSSVYEWLTNLGISKATAADLITINAWEIVAAFTIYKASKSLYKEVSDTLKSRRARKLWERGVELEDLGDYEAADACYQDVIVENPNNPMFDIWYSLDFLHRATKKEQEGLWYQHLTRCYDLSMRARNKIKTDILIPFQGGIVISLWGLASNLLVSSWCGRGENVNIIKGIINSGIEHSVSASNELINKSFGLSRPFSSIANDLIALNLLIDSPFDVGSRFTPIYIRERIIKTLTQVTTKHDEESEYASELLHSINKIYPVTTASS